MILFNYVNDSLISFYSNLEIGCIKVLFMMQIICQPFFFLTIKFSWIFYWNQIFCGGLTVTVRLLLFWSEGHWFESSKKESLL